MRLQIFSPLNRVPAHRLAMTLVMLAVTGCAPQLQTQIVGHATAIVGPRAALFAAQVAVPESHSAQVLRYVVALPRAVQLDYQVTCPSAERKGTMGETLATYRTRRLAELERARQQQAEAIGSLVGAIARPARAAVTVAGPAGSASVGGAINPGAAAAMAAHQALPIPELPPGDTGANVVRGSVELGASAAGRCVLTLAPEPPGQDASGASVQLELMRLIDVEAEERGRRAALEAAADRRGRELRLWLLGSLQRAGADPLARQRAQASAQARADDETRRRAAAAEAEGRRRATVASAAERERLQREQQATAERDRREAPERARRAAAERERAARQEVERRAQLARQAEVQGQAERESAACRARAWQARQAAFQLRWRLLLRLHGLGADPGLRQRLEAERLAARQEQQRRLYEMRARREVDAEAARRTAISLRFALLARLRGLGADPDDRRHRDEAMFVEMDAEARRLELARVDAAARVRAETQAAIDLRVVEKLRLRQLGAVDRPTCPAPPAETPPPAPFASATWISGRYDWNGLAWIWRAGHYERPPEAGTVWVPPAQFAISGTLVVRPGRWVRITIVPPH